MINGQTAVVDANSAIKRKQWMHQGLIQAMSVNAWAPLIGNSADSVVYQTTNSTAGDKGKGHEVTFDYEGNLAGRAIKGKKTATGKGEQKKLFSDSISVERYRLVVDNGDKFDGVDIGNLAITEHGNARTGLGDLFTRFTAQSLFDAASGLLGQAPSHIREFDGIAGAAGIINELIDIEIALRTGTGFTSGSNGGMRRPLKPIKMENGQSFWILKVDSFVAGLIKKSSSYQTMIYNADLRGEKSRAFTGIIGKIGSLIVQEDPSFFGDTDAGTDWDLDQSGIEIAGMRNYDVTNSKWSGQEGWDYTNAIRSRCYILGKGALQMGFGKQPEYHHQFSRDFKINSESAVEFWMNAQKTILLKENTDDYKMAKVADMDFGVMVWDVDIKAAD